MISHLTKIKEIDAKGGPSATAMGGDGLAKTSTTAGRFVIHSLEKHVSPERYAWWSGIPWGTPMRLNAGVTEIKLNGTWQPLTNQKKWSAFKDDQPAVTKVIIDYYNGTLGYADSFPDKWVFNDFGHISVKYFRDLNNDRKLNGKESIMGDFIHTTPVDESRTAQKLSVTLAESHGCIHIKPLDIDELISKEYLRRGNTVEVHPYSETVIPNVLDRKNAKPFFEFHFYPAKFIAAIYKVG